MRGIAGGLFPMLAPFKDVWGQWEQNLMVLTNWWGRQLVSCRQMLALTGESPKGVSEPCVLQISLKEKGHLRWLSGVPTVLADQEADGMPAERRHIMPSFHLTEKKSQILSTCRGGIEFWAERNEGAGHSQENQVCTSCYQELWHVLPSSSFLSSALLLCCDEKQNQPCVLECGSGAFTLQDCLFYVSSLAPRRDWKAPASGVLDLLLMNAAFIT